MLNPALFDKNSPKYWYALLCDSLRRITDRVLVIEQTIGTGGSEPTLSNEDFDL